MNPIDLTDLFHRIGEISVQASNSKAALDQIMQVIRPAFIFDNLVVFRLDPSTKNLEVFYARATGRGKSAEADMAWGENIAMQVISSRQMICQEPEPNTSQNRLDMPYILAFPLQINQNILGALVFIRFGGPAFLGGGISLAQFVSYQVSWLLERNALMEKQDTLEEQNKAIRLQDDFISTITHELRSPLGFIKGYTTTLLRSDANWNEKTQKEFLNIIDQETDNLQELIENLLDSARLQAGQLKMDIQIVRLDALIKDVIQRTRLHAPNLKVNIEIDPTIPSIQGDPRRLAQVFENLLTNAVKYAPDSDVTILIRPEGKFAEIIFKDHGPGISAEYLPHIFERFFRVPQSSRTVHGTGLGLSICRQIIQNHYGNISAESEEGKGTTFRILLPLPASSQE